MKLELVVLLKHTNTEIGSCYSYYNDQKYRQCEEIFTKYIDTYSNDPDILHNLACSLFMQQKYEQALTYFKRSANIIWSYHSSYHFVSSALCYNKGLQTGDVKHFEKAEFLYHENTDAKEAISGKIANQKQNPLYMFDATNTLGDSVIFERNRSKFCESDDYLKEVEKEHFDYHCMAARQFFNRGICFWVLKQNDIAKFDINRALEFDLKNPDNQFYKDFADNLHLS